MKPLTHLLQPRELGNAKGRCIICGVETSRGFPLRRLPSTFMDWWRVRAGNVVCEYCWRFLRDPQIRRKSWVITDGNIVFLKSRKDAHKFIVEPPDPPFAIYIAIGGKRHGWIPMVHRGVNWSRDVLTVGTEDGLVTFKRSDYIELYELVSSLLKRGAKKSWLQGPAPNPRLYIVASKADVERLMRWWGTGLLRLVLLLA